MSRSAADATRFTATGPYASSKSGSTFKWPGSKTKTAPADSPAASGSGTAPRRSSGPPGETPKQKVERLRAEARRARIEKTSSPIDRFLARGRVWADRAHKVTIYSLIAASGIAGVLTIYSISSLVVYNRRQKTLWVEREMQRLLDAKKAYIAGSATTDQLELLEKEKAAEDAHRKKEEMKKQTYIYKAKEMVFGGLRKDEDKEGEERGLGLPELGREKSGVLEAVNAKRMEDNAAASEKQMGTPQQDTPGGNAEPEAKKSWTSWILRR